MQLMNIKTDHLNRIPEKIINRYYQKFYQTRRSNLQDRQQAHRIQQSIGSLHKHDLVFNINYETSQSKQPKNTISAKLGHSLSKNSTLNETTQIDKSKSKYEQCLAANNQNYHLTKKNIIFQVQVPTVPVGNSKGSKNHRKTLSNQNSSKQQSFQHFPSENELIKNNSKHQSHKSNFVTITDYSKTINFDHPSNPEKDLFFASSTVDTSPSRKDNFFTLQSFSHIQLHNNRKKSRPMKKKQIVDIIKRNEVSPSKSIPLQAQYTNESRKMIQSFKQKPQKKLRIKEQVDKKTGSNQIGFYKDFKPKIQLKKRPSTGTPMKRGKNNSIQKSKNNPTQQSTRQLKDPNIQSFQNFDSHFTTELAEKKHARNLSLKLDSHRGLSVESKQIHLLRYINLSETQKIKEILQRSQEMKQKKMKNAIHLQFQKRNSLNLQRCPKNKSSRKDQQFKPWESTQREDEFNQNFQLIKPEIEGKGIY